MQRLLLRLDTFYKAGHEDSRCFVIDTELDHESIVFCCFLLRGTETGIDGITEFYLYMTSFKGIHQ